VGLRKRAAAQRRARKAHAAAGSEDPVAVFERACQGEVAALQQLRSSAAQLLAAGKRLEGQLEAVTAQRSRLRERAREALAEGDEARAVEQLTLAEALDTQIADLTARVGQLNELRAKLEENGRQLEARVVAARAQVETLRSQFGAAQAAVAAGEALARLGPGAGELEALVHAARDKVEWTQARAEALGELNQSGALGGPVPTLGTGGAGVRAGLDELRAELEARSQAGLEARLQAGSEARSEAPERPPRPQQ